MTRILRQNGYSLIELLGVVGLVGVVSAIALPMTSSTVSDLRTRGDARAISNTVALAKLRATSGFTRTRVVGVLGSGTFFIQIWNKTTNQWVAEGGINSLSSGVQFGFAGLTTPPPNTQDTLGQSSPCLQPDGTEIGGTACVVFNSRGIPIDDASGAPTGDNGLYITDGVTVYGTTITATPLVRLWWSPANTPEWTRQ